jgi:hypothetical protein
MHLLQQGYDNRAVQKLLGYKHVKTTMTDTPCLDRRKLGVRSPLDAMWRSRSLPLSWWLGSVADTAAHTWLLQGGAVHREQPRLSTLCGSLFQS